MPSKDEMSSFAKAIDELVSKTDYNYIEAIVEYCNQTGLELEVAATLVNNNLKAKIELDAIESRMIKFTGNRLPL